MDEKLNPVLQERVERALSAAGGQDVDRIDVIVALRRPADEDTLADLADRGLGVRSVIGDILTGSVEMTAVPMLAESDEVVTIEAGGLLTLENGDTLSE